MAPADRPRAGACGRHTRAADRRTRRAAAGRRRARGAQPIDAVLEWLRTRLAQALECSPEQIGDEDPFARWGLDSAVAVTLTGELAAWLRLDLDPTVFWEYAHPLALAEHLAGLLAARAGAGDPVELV